MYNNCFSYSASRKEAIFFNYFFIIFINIGLFDLGQIFTKHFGIRSSFNHFIKKTEKINTRFTLKFARI